MFKKFFNKRITYKYTVAICCIVKDENPYLHEWINFHMKIGVEHFYIYDNESKIPVSTTLEQLVTEGIVDVTVLKGKVQQLTAYRQCIQQYGAECQWIAFIDADEFIVPKNPSGNLPDFLSLYEQFGGLGVNWLVFGSNNHIEKQKSQISSYTKRSLKTHLQNKHYKTIVQTRYVKPEPVDPHRFLYKKRKYCVNENFVKIIESHTEVHSSNKIQLNHYNLRSLVEFKEKILRGRADTDDALELRDLNYFYSVDQASTLITDEAIIELQMMLGSAGA